MLEVIKNKRTLHIVLHIGIWSLFINWLKSIWCCAEWSLWLKRRPEQLAAVEEGLGTVMSPKKVTVKRRWHSCKGCSKTAYWGKRSKNTESISNTSFMLTEDGGLSDKAVIPRGFGWCPKTGLVKQVFKSVCTVKCFYSSVCLKDNEII